MPRTTVHRVTAFIFTPNGDVDVEAVVRLTPPSGFNGPPEGYDPGDAEVGFITATLDGEAYELTTEETERAEEALIAKANNE